MGAHLTERLLLFPALCFLTSSCISLTPAPSSATQQVASTVVDWNELVSERPGDPQNSAPDETLEPVDLTKLTLTPYRVMQFPPKLRQEPKLMHIAINRSVESPQSFSNGVYGKIGSAVFYGTTLDRVPDWDRLYWVMVKVLSEKYGCFMRAKVTRGNINIFFCRDSRRVVFWRAKGNDWIQFHARQFDASWRELVVQRGQIVDRKYLFY